MVYSLGKWYKYKILAASRGMVSFLPRTRKLNEQNLWILLNQYKRVIVKPSSGSGGVGVLQVASQGKGRYNVHYGRSHRTLVGRKATYSFVNHRARKSGGYIVQQKIPLAKVKGRPFDIRVMIQKSRKSGWVITGKLAKIAGSGYIITNTARSRGRVLPVSTAIHHSNIKGRSTNQIQLGIDLVAKKVTHRLHQHYHKLHTVGVDIGLDSAGKAWLIEANFAPSKSLFLHLKDKSAYRRIMAFNRK